ncbi:mechanosensitive ion channel family protein [Sulfurimonas microaerophilic]|uniref:mechanosensitive ion channel family protein n=1 Tax=Sulfurimonas microaerophilic TaxID=3058392 RepID=UPI0027153A55|nr:mechanosensitive ion channel domain-containing protein [Sulfurimonas sp. hsl 1-7]
MDFNKYADLALVYLSEYGLKIVAALAIFIIGKWVAKKLSVVTKTMMTKAKVDITLSEFTESLVYFSLLAMVILASLNALGINTTSFIAVFGAASLAVGLALQGSLANVGAAVLIIIFRPFKIGDFIEAGGATGTVDDITMFSTIISPLDNRTIIVPNSKIIGGNIVNFSKKEKRRVDLTFGIGYDDDLRLAKQVLIDILNSDERIHKDPEPFVAVSELGDSSVNFITRAWVDTANYWDVYFNTIEKVKLTFDEKGITIPYPQMDVHMKKEEN